MLRGLEVFSHGLPSRFPVEYLIVAHSVYYIALLLLLGVVPHLVRCLPTNPSMG